MFQQRESGGINGGATGVSPPETKIGCGIEMLRNLSIQDCNKASTATRLRPRQGSRGTPAGELSFLRGFAAAAAAGGGLSGSFADEFGGPDGSDEFFYAVIVKINRGSISI
jgi:hypothetical protein